MSAAQADVGEAPPLFPKYPRGCPRKALRPALSQYLTKLVQHEVGKGPHTRVVAMMRVAENPKVRAVLFRNVEGTDQRGSMAAVFG